jgi:putative transposase
MVAADRFYPSTKACSSCGAVKAKLPLSTRTYDCDSCDLVLDRDVNAAVNLAAWGERHLAVSASRAGDRHPGGPSAEQSLRGRHACGGDNEPAPVLAGVPGEAGTSQLAVTGAA